MSMNRKSHTHGSQTNPYLRSSMRGTNLIKINEKSIENDKEKLQVTEQPIAPLGSDIINIHVKATIQPNPTVTTFYFFSLRFLNGLFLETFFL